MPKQKRDYPALKKEFMESEFYELNAFLGSKGIPYNRKMRENMKGWGKEKKEFKARATERALKKAATKLSNQLEPSSEFLLGNIAKAIELTKVKLDQMEAKGNINVKDLNTIRGMNRIQNGQPTTYVKEEQDVNQNIRLEGIHIVMGGNPNDSGGNNKPKEV